MKKLKTIIGLIIAFVIGVSTTVGATTIFNSKDITYSNNATSKTNVKDSLDELYTKANTPWKCAAGYYCYTTFCPTGYIQGTYSEGFSVCKKYKLISEVKVGDYISMTPTSTSYTISTSLTGYTSNQTINPSELNLWRVIRKNSDGTIDVISEYVSNVGVSFRGQVGYLNYIGGLNTIASQYTNTKYVSKTRHMGYSNQIEKCTELSTTICPTDVGYETDINLVQTVTGTLLGKKQDGTVTAYLLASRFANSTYKSYYIRYISTSGTNTTNELYRTSNNSIVSYGSSIRPILTLKAGIQIKSGDGKTASTAYKLV